MNSFREIIDAWPSRGLMAEDMGLEGPKPTAKINLWHHRDSIPPPFWQAVVRAAKGRRLAGITLEAITRFVSKDA